MFGGGRGAIWDKLLGCIFENSFKFSKITRVIIPKIAWTKYVLTGRSHQTNIRFVLKLISFNSRPLQNSGQLQKSSVNGAVLITTNYVINSIIAFKIISRTLFNYCILIQRISFSFKNLFTFNLFTVRICRDRCHLIEWFPLTKTENSSARVMETQRKKNNKKRAIKIRWKFLIRLECCNNKRFEPK